MGNLEFWKGSAGFKNFCAQFFIFSVGCIDERLFKDWEGVRYNAIIILEDIYMKIEEEGLGDNVQKPFPYIKAIIKHKAFDLNKKKSKDGQRCGMSSLPMKMVSEYI